MTPNEIFTLLKEKFGDAVAFTEAKQVPAPKPAAPPAPAAGAVKPAVPGAPAAAKPAVPPAPKPAAATPAAPVAPKVETPKPEAMAPKPEGEKPAEAPKPHAPPAAAAAEKPAAPAVPVAPAAPKPAAPAAPAGAAAAPKPAAPAAAKPAGAMVSIGDPFIKVSPPEKLPDVMAFLRDDPRTQFDLLHDLSGLDQKDCTEVVYHLNSLPRKHWLVVKIALPRITGVAPTVAHLWKTAIWHEREAFDLFGMKFAGNPDLRRILLPDDWEGHPLLKDYKVQEFYRGMPVPYHAEHWTGEGTLVTKMEDVSADSLEQWYEMGLKPAVKAAEAAAAAPVAVGAATATAVPPKAENKTESKPGEAPKPADPGKDNPPAKPA